MNFLLSSFLFIFSTFSLITNSTVVPLPLPLPPLLSLRCSPSPSTHHHHNINPIRTLLDNLTSVAVDSRFTTFNTTFRQGRYSGLMQCRPGLRPQACILCASAAGNTILNLCPNSNAVSVWYDGCYVQISMMMMNSSHDRDHDHEGFMDASNHSCSNRAKNQDLARSGPALEALLLKLKADVNLATHHGFSQGEIAYDNINHSDSKIYGAVECVRSLSPQECDFCVGKAIEKLQFYCGGTNGGTARGAVPCSF
ncbi:UNVERIFIED_CONTAM: hypothetical protein Scaly_1493500 [Sesamum calycinum]|uniref:Gnk2-homologous domain-containing protein n=1 Tax=Sesamum calycinum TaxID=2727403 RepID=A0AAW2PQ64_9LAMI